MRHRWITRLATMTTILVLLSVLATSSMFAQAGQRGGGQRGGRGDGAQAAGAATPIPRFPDGTPNLSWVDPNQKGTWRSGQHWEYGKDQIDPKAREEGLPSQPWAKALHEYRQKTESKDDPEVFCLPPVARVQLRRWVPGNLFNCPSKNASSPNSIRW